MSLTLAQIAELRADLENDVRDLDGQIEYLETMYLEETKEAGNIIKGFQNYVNVRLNPRGSNIYQKRSKLQARQRIFSLSSCRSPANNQLDQLTEVRVDNGVNGTASHTLKRQKRKKNYAQLDQGYKEYSDRNEGDSMNNSQNNYEDYESKSKKKR